MFAVILMVLLKLNVVCSVPLLNRLLQPYQSSFLDSQLILQKQLMELQQQQWNHMPPVALNTLEPFIILLPNSLKSTDMTEVSNKRINDRLEAFNDEHKQEDDEDSVVVDAEPAMESPHRAYLLLPNARLSIGGIISAIPFLPIEINVPDTISWAYNGIASGISSIVSIIWPPNSGTSETRINLKSMLNELNLRKGNLAQPIILLPMRGAMHF